jgi:hypothetical protein
VVQIHLPWPNKLFDLASILKTNIVLE